MKCAFCGFYAAGRHEDTTYDEVVTPTKRTLLQKTWFVCPACGEREMIEQRMVKQELQQC